MVVRKITISLEETAYQAAVAAAKAAGLSLSAWLSRYAEHRARVEEGLRAVAAYEAEYGAAAYEAEHGAVADEAVHGSAADEAGYGAVPGGTEGILDDLGVGAPVPAERDAAHAAALGRLRGNAA